ncbi:DAK2 domain-containing protein [Phascolarctobacterium sp.]|uniref:DAK2 domain-containing protein n=1 Tax=Phascolarctobacterium sp. TaxID=2049039 RepID=UPI003864FAEF
MVEVKEITGKQVKDMLLGAYHSFEKNFEAINDLNVFPVPDGDTGTNMMHTMASVARELSAMSDTAEAGEIGAAAARSAIMGARGNSGVILSQLLRGIGKGVAGKKTLNNTEIGKAFQFGILYAYRSVSKPVEGTILTVARGMAKGTYQAIRTADVSLEDVLLQAIASGKEELAKTPDMLPALKAAGVVDAGGQGLIAFFEGCLAGLRGQDCQVLPVTAGKATARITNTAEPLDLEFPYCTEFIVKGANVDKKTVSEALQGFGNSMIVAVVEDIVKVHIHTKHPGDALNAAQQWGTLHDIKIENMRDQHENRLFTAEDIQPVKHGVGVLSVAAGDGIAKIMHEMGAAEIISGGQSMNPPVEDFVQAIENGTCEEYVILPNNKNIILAAEQVRKLLGNSKVSFVPSTNMAQGLAALLRFDATKSLDENTVVMTKEAKEANGGSVTVAVRDSVVNGLEVHEGDYLGILNDKIVCTGSSIAQVLEQMLADGDYELISMYYGADLTADDAEELAEVVGAMNDDWEVETYYGGQPLYPILLAME